jgi:hypothetical protein
MIGKRFLDGTFFLLIALVLLWSCGDQTGELAQENTTPQDPIELVS